MKSLRSILVLGAGSVLLFGAAYPLLVTAVGQLMPWNAQGRPLFRNGELVGFENIGQPFDQPGFFWGRPSAVDYNAAATGGSNKGPTNEEYLSQVKSRVDTLLKYHPGMTTEDIPADLVTASGSGLDPHISRQAALVQVNRIAAARGLPPEEITALINRHTRKPLLGIFGPGGYVNVLQLNIELSQM